MIWIYKIIEKKFLFPFAQQINSGKKIAWYSLYYLFVLAVSGLCIRGGTQLIPLSIIDAGAFVKPPYVPLVLNTPFCLIKSGELYTVDEKNYMPEEEAEKLFDYIFNLKCIFGGRMLWQLGTTTVDRFGANSLLNCWSVQINELKAAA